MNASSERWKEIARSEFPWEQDALGFIRERLPDRDPYRAWSNFEFIADDGTVNEVDLLVLTPNGLFLVEIKSRPWIVQWHNDVDPATGLRMGEYFGSFVDEEARALGLTREDLRRWEPATTPARGRAGARRATKAGERR